MVRHTEISQKDLISQIKQQKICIAGNSRLGIFGTLRCSSGKRMKKENRVFFGSETDALMNNFRPCGNCMAKEYKKWKDGII